MSDARTSSSADMSAESLQGMMMIPYLHFSGEGYLFLDVWRPSSPGAIAGVCIGLAVFAFLERWLAASSAMLETYWRRRAFALTTARDNVVLTEMVANVSGSIDKHYLVRPATRIRGEASNPSSPDLRLPLEREPKFIMESRKRTIPPFIAAHDIPRGILFALQMTVMYCSC
ncbi:hypothetical protein BJ912DRAFT_351167 [Pholiota molesta]|nr:hypothetical protein BJ912DRAFT_351167 [Pholiota molesta]